MKISLIVIIAIFINTSLLLSQPLLLLAQKINIWMLIGIELTLVLVWYAIRTIKELQKDLEFDLNDLNVFVFNSKKKVPAQNK